MFKISEPILVNLDTMKYNELTKKEILKDYIFNNENIELDKNVEIKRCKFDGIIFDEVNIKFGTLEDVEFINCDLSNLTLIDTHIFRVSFKNCKLFGTNFIDTTLDNIVIEDCMCSMINFTGVKIHNSKICDSNFKSSNIETSELKNIIIDRVNFSNSSFIKTPLKDIDLSNSNIEEINIDLNCIKGSIISLEQTMDLIGLLGVKVKE